jgi:threonine/homoserine/homoserine lactone efflux protein
MQLAALGLVFVLTCGAFYTAVGYSAQRILGTRPAASRIISRISGAAMILVALLLLLDRILATR